MRKKILAISGSTKSGSTNELIIQHIAGQYAADVDVQLFDIATLPYFIPGGSTPEIVEVFRRQIDSADGVLISTPEYVFSLPGVLKNAIEWTVSTMVFNEKPLAFVVASASGQKAYESLELIMKTVGAAMEADSKLLVQGAKGKVTEDGTITDQTTIENLEKLATKLHE
jgi:NAD(P)H-dependent FMN reductase